MFDEHGLPVSAQRIKNAYKEKFESARAMQGHYQMNYKKMSACVTSFSNILDWLMGTSVNMIR
ncbi:hypothetical protein ALP20_01287 [Pseudomonas coronafaciens pv. coronafaciens]|nr:hypothetical protein ALP20_01287 [Pseudomonas coronafaciens pv. coronafaciens]